MMTEQIKKTKKYVNDGGYMCLPDSERIEVGDTIIFACDSRKTVFAYKRGVKAPTASFRSDDWAEYRAQVASLVTLAEQVENEKIVSKTSHTLRKGTVMVCHTNIKVPQEDTVRFFQIEAVLPGGEVAFYEILADEIAFTGCKQSVPLVGMKVGDLMKSTVLVDSITIDEKLIGKKLDYQSINLDGVELKFYEPQYHSLFA